MHEFFIKRNLDLKYLSIKDCDDSRENPGVSAPRVAHYPSIFGLHLYTHRVPQLGDVPLHSHFGKNSEYKCAADGERNDTKPYYTP